MKTYTEKLAEAYEILKQKQDFAKNALIDRKNELYDKLPAYGEAVNLRGTLGSRLCKISVTESVESENYKKTLAEMAENEKKIAEILKNAGYPANYFENEYFCEKCKDEGTIIAENGETVSCECFKKILSEIILEDSDLPVKKGFEAFDLNIFDEKDRENAENCLKIAKEMAEKFPADCKWLILGKTGVGKTFTASLLGTELAKKAIDVAYVRLSDIYRTVLYFGEDEKLVLARDAMLKQINTVQMLIIDELGAEKISDAKQDFLTALIDRRATDNKTGTIVITNNSLREILDNYGERIFSRLTSFKITEFKTEASGDLRVRG